MIRKIFFKRGLWAIFFTKTFEFYVDTLFFVYQNRKLYSGVIGVFFHQVEKQEEAIVTNNFILRKTETFPDIQIRRMV